MPNSVRFELGGAYAQQQIAFRGLAVVFGAALAAVFVLLLFLYENFATAITILVMPLLAVCAVFIGLWVTGIELNITAMMGMTMIVGIVTEVAMFFFSEFVDLAAGRPVPVALVEAGQNRMRPIAMTTLAAILTLPPLALAIGQGFVHAAAPRRRDHLGPGRAAPSRAPGNAEHLLIVVPCPLVVTTAMELADRAL